MSKYLFITGQSPELAQAELEAILSKENLKLSGSNFILAQSDKSAKKLMSILGSSVKIAKYLDTLDSLENINAQWWYKILEKNLHLQNKNYFAFSLYNDNNKNYQKIKKIAFQVKKYLKTKKYKSRLVTGQEKTLSSVIVAKNKLINHELIIIKNKDKYLVGITEAVQDFAAYGFRDIKRPNRDDKSGMLPPKIAQTMINLAGPNTNRNILDPFCGSGTVLQEAMMLGFKKIYGSDISLKAVKQSNENLAWLGKNFNLSANIKIIKSDIKNLDKYLGNQSIDLIVSEPFMGDARFIIRQKKPADLIPIKNDLQKLYHLAFAKFQKILNPQGLVVFIFPVFNISGQDIYTLDKKTISLLGFDYQLDKNLIYARPGQKVKRQITVWQKN